MKVYILVKDELNYETQYVEGTSIIKVYGNEKDAKKSEEELNMDNQHPQIYRYRTEVHTVFQ